MIEELIKNFRPEFGNQNHLQIIEMIGKWKKLKEHVESHKKRVQQLQNSIAKQTKAEQNLSLLESQLTKELQ